MTPDLTVKVQDLVGHLEKERGFSGEREVHLRLGDSAIDGAMSVKGTVRGTVDGAHVSFAAVATGRFQCVRCLREWSENLEVAGSQHFGLGPDEDGYGIVDGEIDVAAPARDELALSLPAAPVCKEDCRGLCPICGSDLNVDPCDGHGDDPDSPFSVLKDLFDSP